ncbi:MAG: DNA-directed DNA polymerase, partial [Candidatus Diapherotrites archaeon]|nr:DNA-directed DNA polymerase [Candidatus Diapherotrites archaeon]
MGESKVNGVLLDVDYANRGGKSVIRLFVRTSSGIEIFEDPLFRPYFFVTVEDPEKAGKALLAAQFSEGAKIAGARSAKTANAEKALRLEFDSVQHLAAIRNELGGIPGIVERFEYDIPFAKRYLLDHELRPMSSVLLEVDGNEIKKAEPAPHEKENPPEFRIVSFDLETLSPERFSDPKKDPVLMASIAGAKKAAVLSYEKKFTAECVEKFPGEKEMLQELLQRLRKSGADIIATYNGDGFDFPYLMARCEKFGLKTRLGADGTEPQIKRKGMDNTARLRGVQHLDVYKMLRFLNRFGVVNLVKFDLESVVASLYGENKGKITAKRINEIWRSSEGLDELAAYCREDSESAEKIALQYLPLLGELCRLVKQTLFEVSRSSASMLVEYLIMNKCRQSGNLIANKPDDSAVQARLMQTYVGGFVRQPLPGLHENIAVLDFSSLHPTIMISHNISPDTLRCGHEECRQKNLAPNEQWFCTKKDGLLASILRELFDRRMQIKKQIKETKGKENKEYGLLNARQHALKILLNSFYGYLGYARSRFYSRECASAITAWSRQYVQWVGEKAEEAGFKVLYGDTDSAHLEIPSGMGKSDVEEFVASINKQLPGVMNLELEGLYKRGIFVTKESGEAAKKKYALIDAHGNLKIVGFEYVRRDWAP